MTTELVKWDSARKALAEATSIDEVKAIHDKVVAFQAYARQTKQSLEVQNDVAEFKLKCERSMGEMLKETDLNVGGRPNRNRSQLATGFSTLDDIGINKSQSSRYQTIARLPEKAFEQHVAEVKENNRELTEVGLISHIKQVFRQTDMAKQREQINKRTAQMPKGLFDVIVVDPPWPYETGNNYDPDGFRGGTPYPEMSLEQIKGLTLPVADDCVLWLWTTHKFMRHAFVLLDEWGFRDVSILCWVKNKMGIGKWLRSKSEYCIMAVKGKPKVFLTNQTTVLQADVGVHSKKPDMFYKMVEELCVGRKLDVFARNTRDGWSVYGNEVNPSG